MTESGTYAFRSTFETVDIFTEAFERCQVFEDVLSGRHLESARRSINLMFGEWTNTGPNLWAVDEQTQALAASTPSYTLATGTAHILEAYSRDSDDNDVLITPFSRSEYASLSDKDQEADRPTNFYLDRQITPVIFLWPVPDNATHTLRYFRMKYIEDVSSTLTQTADVPHEWMEATCAGLAAKLAVKWAPNRADTLTAYAQTAYKLAAEENRERVPLRITPDFLGSAGSY